MKKETARVAITVTAGFALFFLTVGTSPSFQSCVQEHQNHAAHGSLDKYVHTLLFFYKAGRGCGGEWLHEHGEAIIALFTVILGIATWLLWRSTRDLVNEAKATAERQLRAYVMIDKASVKNLGPGGEPVVNLLIRNSGQTPAHDVKHWVASGIAPYPLSEAMLKKIMGEETELPPKPVAPNGEFNLPSESEVLTEASYGGLFNKTHALYVVGEIRYRDAFGVDRETDFLLFTGGPIGVQQNLATYITGNRIT